MPRWPYPLLFAVLPIPAQVMAQSAAPVIQGRTVTCADLTAFGQQLNAHNDSYFTAWNDADYIAVNQLIARCIPHRQDLLTQYLYAFSSEKRRIAELRSQQRQQEAQQDRLDAQKQRDAKLAQERSDAAAIQQARDIRKQTDEREQVERAEADEERQNALETRYQQCKATQPYRLFAAQERIVRDVALHEQARKAIEYETKVGERSGFVDATKMHDAGEIQLRTESAIQADWTEYQALGGSAQDPINVAHTYRNPCAKFVQQ